MVDTTGTWIEKNVEIKYIICAFYITRYLSDPVLLACWIDTLRYIFIGSSGQYRGSSGASKLRKERSLACF
jgi:hypothetical protein